MRILGNGCKTFFRRTIMKGQTFVCQFDGKCPVDKSIRCACRHCRFEKCLQVWKAIKFVIRKLT